MLNSVSEAIFPLMKIVRGMEASCNVWVTSALRFYCKKGYKKANSCVIWMGVGVQC